MGNELTDRIEADLRYRVKHGLVESWASFHEAHGDGLLRYTVTVPGFRSITLSPGDAASWLGLEV